MAALLLAPAIGFAAEPSPVGAWRTFDDLDGRESGFVVIFDRNGQLYGNITSISDRSKADAMCTRCTDDRKDKPVSGMQVIRGLQRDGDYWDGGQVIDPLTGKIYRCSTHLINDGRKLVIRGYVGIPLLGRSQTWIRK